MSHASTGLISIEEAAEANKLPGTAPTDKRYPMTNQIKTCYMCAAAATLARRRRRRFYVHYQRYMYVIGAH